MIHPQTVAWLRRLEAAPTDPQLVATLPFGLRSRIHPLRSVEDGALWLKRDDELGGAASGSKFRKYQSLLPWLASGGFGEAALIGTLASNNVVAASLLLREAGIVPRLFLKAPRAGLKLRGNALLTALAFRPDEIHWLATERWPEAVALAEAFADEARAEGRKVAVLGEGSTHAAALLGAVSLAFDILANEADYEVRFDAIVVDAGTAFQAAALIAGLALVQCATPVHVVRMAGTANEARAMIQTVVSALSRRLGRELDAGGFELHEPASLKSFGATGRQSFAEIARGLREDGVLTEPIYSAKLVTTARELYQAGRLGRRALIVHSGGLMTLAGFQGSLARQAAAMNWQQFLGTPETME